MWNNRTAVGILGLLLAGMLTWQTGLLALAGDSYSMGLSAYKQAKYTQAAQYMKQAVIENPHDAKRVFYLGLIYAKTNQMSQARQAFEQVLQMVPTADPLAAKARNNVSYITNTQMINVSNVGKASQLVNAGLTQGGGSNYLTFAVTDGKVIRFDEKKMPLKIYIADGKGVPGWSNDLKSVVTYATNTWSRATKGRVSFVTTQDPNNADINVRWQRNFRDNLLGVSPYQFAGSTLIRSDVTLAVFYPESSQPIPLGELQAIAVHELGHAIGIKGHSPYPEDIMYFSRNGRQSLKLSQRDINTINLLYKFEADVKNSSTMSIAQSKKYYELFKLGVDTDSAGQTSRAMAYYRQAIAISSEPPEAKYNLGVLLLGQAKEAINNQNLSLAQVQYEEAAQLFQSVVSSGKSLEGLPPNAASRNLEVARHNLSVVKSMRSQGG